MKLYTEEQVDKMLSRARMHKQDDTEMFTNEYLLSKETPIELPNDDDVRVGNDGFEFDHNSTIPPTKGLCDAKSIYGSELNKELTLDERMHLWFESSRPNRDVCDYVDEMNDIDKAKYLDGCGISRTTKL
jgi:hypothetical protein